MHTRERLAIDGGRPVRREPLPVPYLGPWLMGDEELELLRQVIQAKAPFRAYGINPPHMVDDFEAEARGYLGTRFALATATGSGSILAALAGLGVGPGDEVLIPSFSWHTNFQAPVLLGATPVFVDIDRSLNLDVDDLVRRIGPRSKVLMVVHFQGATHRLNELLDVAARHDLKVLEDCAQAFGATVRGRKAGSLGDVGCFSLQQNKVITCGDGGLLVTDDPVIFERAARFHDLGQLRPPFLEQLEAEDVGAGFCASQFRMNELSGAVALAQLRKVDAILASTRAQHRRLRELIAKECIGLELRQVDDREGDTGTAFFMDLKTEEAAERFAAALVAEGIRVGPSSGCRNLLHDPIVLQKRMAHPALPPFGSGWPGEGVVYAPHQCPATDAIVASMVCVALSPAYTEEDVRDIGTAIVAVWNAVR